MGTQHKKRDGFTIIEVVLFLAISGALAIGILASSSIAINNQRYRDSLNSLQSLLQQQYNQTSNVINQSTSRDKLCDTNGIATKEVGQGAERGTSQCLIMGRYVAISNGQAIKLSNVIGFGETTGDAANDMEELRKYKFFVSESEMESNEVAWGGTVNVKSPDGQSFTQPNQIFVILILRSPLTGAIRTVSYNTNAAGALDINSQAVLVSDNLHERDLCLDPGAFMVGTKLGVAIRENAANSSGIEILQDDNKC
jgi:type II secretory pathway pseudopilin PulG